VKQEIPADDRSLNASALDALQEAREMPPGAERSDALKRAGLLRRVADDRGLTAPKRGRPRKSSG